MAGKIFKIATAAAVLGGSLALSEPAFAGGHGGFGGGGFHGGGGGWHGGGGGWHGGGGGWHGGGGGWRGGGWGGPGWRGGGWGGPGWGWGGGGWGWGVPLIVGGGSYYYPSDGYYDDGYPAARRVYVRRVVHRSCIWRRVRVHTPYGLSWRRVRYCAQ
jgi:hypothetical protein